MVLNKKRKQILPVDVEDIEEMQHDKQRQSVNNIDSSKHMQS